MALDAEGLFRRLVEHENFARLCQEIYNRAVHKKSMRPVVRAQLRDWLRPYEEKLSEEEFQQLFQQLYTATLKAVWQLVQVSQEATPDTSLFPDVAQTATQSDLLSARLLAFSGEGREFAPSEANASDESLFPDLPRDADFPTLTARSLMALPAISGTGSSEVARDLRAPSVRGEATQAHGTERIPRLLEDPVSEATQAHGTEGESMGARDASPAEGGEAAAERFEHQALTTKAKWSVAPPAGTERWMQDSLRFQTIPFEAGFYMLDRETGATWFMPAGGSEFLPCFYEAGDVSSVRPTSFPPVSSEAARASGTKAGSVTPSEITISFPEEEGPQEEGDKFQGGLASFEDDEESRSSTLSNSYEGFDLSLLEPEESSPGSETSDDLASPTFSSELFEAFSSLPSEDRETLDDETFEPPTLPPPPLFTPSPLQPNEPQRGEHETFLELNGTAPFTNFPEELSGIPEVGAFSSELSPTLLPNRLQPGEGASFEALHGFDPLNQEILSHFPYPIARLYEAFLAENDPRLRLRLLMFVFIHLVKYATFPLLIQYLKHPDLHDVATHQALLRLQSTRWSAWMEFLRCAVELFHGTAVPFTEEVCEAFHRLETERSPQDRFLYTQRFLDPLGEERVTHLHLGLFEALVVYRDSFVHGFTPTVEQAYEDLLTYESILRTIFEEMRFLSKYPLLYTFQQRADGTCLCYPLMGTNPSPSVQFIEVSASGLGDVSHPMFLMSPQGESETLPLFPLLVSAAPREEDSPIPSQHHAIFLFHGCNGEKLLYHNLWQVPYLTDEPASVWKALLSRSAFPPASSSCHLSRVVKLAKTWTERQLEQLRFNQQYYPELTIPRRSARRVFDDFTSSQALALLIYGVSGVGKSSFMASQAERLLGVGQPVVWLRGCHLQGDISAVIGAALGLPRAPRGDSSTAHIAGLLGPVLSSSAPLLLVLDDVEMYAEGEAFWEALDRWLAELAESGLSGYVKVVLLLQSAFLQGRAVKELFRRSHEYFFSFEDDYLSLYTQTQAFELPYFFPDEAEFAFRRYRNFQNGHGIAPFRPLSTWESLSVDGGCREVLRHPLLLRIAMATFCQQELPASLSVDGLFQQYLEQVIEEKYAPLPIPERLQFLRVLLALFFRLKKAVLTRAELYDAEEPLLLRALQNAHTDSPLIQLFHLGVLVEEWQEERCWIRFSSERLFHFLLSREWMQQVTSFDVEAMFALTEGELLLSPLPDLFFFLWIELLRKEKSASLCAWLHQHLEILGGLLEAFLLELIQSDDSCWRSFVVELQVEASDALQDIFRRVSERLVYNGFEERAREFLELLLQSTSLSGQQGLGEIELLFRYARLCELHGAREKALALYQQCRVRLDKLAHAPLSVLVGLRLASLFRQDGLLEEARRHLELVLAQTDLREYPQLEARLNRQLGNMAYEQGLLEQALPLYQRSLRIDEGCGNLRGIATSLSNLGTIYGSQEQLAEALSHYHRCLEIHERLGDRKDAATTFNNIGIIYRRQGKYEHALKMLLRALALREELGLFQEVLATRENISLLYRQLGNVEQAKTYIQENLKLLKRQQDPLGMAQALHQLGELSMLVGDDVTARAQLEEARSLFVEYEDPANEARVLLSLGQLAEFHGELALALENYRKARRYFESIQDAVELISALRAIASIYAQREQLEEATNELQHALSLAEQLQLGTEVLDMMIELAHVRLLRQDVPAAQAYTDRAVSLSQEHHLFSAHKDLLALQARLSIREDDWLKLSDLLRELEEVLAEMSFDPNIPRTVWALFEAATFFQDLDHQRALSLCERALSSLHQRFFVKRQELEQLREQLLKQGGFDS